MASEIMEVFKKLSKDDQKALNHAFEEKETLVIQYEPPKFIGVNVSAPRYLKSTEHGPWSLGTVT